MNVFDSYADAGQKLPLDERMPFYCALIEYLRYGNVPDYLEGGALAVWTAIFPSLEISRSRSISGTRGANKRHGKGEFCHVANDLANGLANGMANDLANGLAKSKSSSNKERVPKGTPKKGAFAPPSLEEVEQRIREKGYTRVSAEAFHGYYSSNGWKVGKNPMKDWRAALASWEARERGKAPAHSMNSETDWSLYE